MNLKPVVIASALMIASGCHATGNGSAPAPVMVPSASAPLPPSSSQPPASTDPIPLGTWSSPRCAERAYPREVNFESQGSFQATDSVSPCPPGAKCIWSGIISWQGSWQLLGSNVRLSPSTTGRLPSKVPSQLRIDAGQLWEDTPTLSCPYSRVP